MAGCVGASQIRSYPRVMFIRRARSDMERTTFYSNIPAGFLGSNQGTYIAYRIWCVTFDMRYDDNFLLMDTFIPANSKLNFMGAPRTGRHRCLCIFGWKTLGANFQRFTYCYWPHQALSFRLTLPPWWFS